MRAKLLVISMLISVLTFSQEMVSTELTFQSSNGYEVIDEKRHSFTDDDLLFFYDGEVISHERILNSYVEISGNMYVRLTFIKSINELVYYDFEIIGEEVSDDGNNLETICEGHGENEFVMIYDNLNTKQTIIEFITTDDKKIIKERRYLYKFDFLK